MREVKQVIVMRKDLGMRKGKMIAQGAHASLGALLNHYSSGSKEYRIFIPKNSPAHQWLEGPFVKICVGVPDEETLHFIAEQARRMKIPYALIKDAGRTEFKEPTYTCCGIGPWWADEINKITGDLKLL
jgi:PTH2 family peptidyl-tRNA hydrolase